jgi:hypothetical protein
LLERSDSFRASKRSNSKKRASQATIASEKKERKPEISKLIEAEEAATGSIGFGVYIEYFKKVGLWLSIFALGSNIFYQAASIFSNG